MPLPIVATLRDAWSLFRRDRDLLIRLAAPFLFWPPLAVALLAAELAESGRALLDRLDELAQEHGLFVTGQLSVRV